MSRDADVTLLARAFLLGCAVVLQRIAAWVGRLAITAEHHYARLTEATHG